MITALAWILVADAIVLASLQQADLPDDFRRQSGSAAVETIEPQPIAEPVSAPVEAEPLPVATVRFSRLAQAGLVKHRVESKERYLVSESWCPNCPAAKRKFLESGGKPENIITIKQAKALGETVSAVPHEFSMSSVSEQYQPPTYREQWPPKWHLDHDWTPSKEKYLSHLRSSANHAGKHWQKWHIESWSRAQLAALHDDDHTGSVPTFDGLESAEAVVSGMSATPDLIADVLATHLAKSQTTPPVEATGSLFSITVETPDGARKWASDLLSRKQVDFANGVSIVWGGDRVIALQDGRITIKPGAKVTGRKFGISVSASLTGISYEPNLSAVTLELDGAPDLTVRFQ